MPTALGENNGYVKNHEASGRMVVDYSRAPSKFALNKYVKVQPVQQSTGYYARLDREEMGRVVNSGDEFVWPDGAAAPSGNPHQREFEFEVFKTKRHAYPWTLGEKGNKQDTLKIQDRMASSNAQKAMTKRTQDVVRGFTTPANHEAGHVIDVSAFSTGTWAQSTTQRGDIKRSIRTMQELLLDATLASVNEEDFILVISSLLASEISQCQEIVDYIKRSPIAINQIRGDMSSGNPNAMYDLPKSLYGIDLVVEKTRKATNRRKAARNVEQVLAGDTPFMTARPGGVEGIAGDSNFSGGTLFVFEEMKVETFRDKKNRRVEGRIVDDYGFELTAPASCGMFQNVL